MKLCKCGCGTELGARRTLRYVRGHQRGKFNSSWKGGRKIMSGGYIGILMPEHNRTHSNGYAPEHVLLAEIALGKPLPKGAVVHHVNGNRRDNRPENLVVCPDHAYHMLLHRRARALEACGNPNWRKCYVCQAWGPPTELVRNYHPACDAAARRARRERAA